MVSELVPSDRTAPRRAERRRSWCSSRSLPLSGASSASRRLASVRRSAGAWVRANSVSSSAKRTMAAPPIFPGSVLTALAMIRSCSLVISPLTAALPAGVACRPPASMRPWMVPRARPSFSASIAATPPGLRPLCMCSAARSAVASEPVASSRRPATSVRMTASANWSASRSSQPAVRSASTAASRRESANSTGAPPLSGADALCRASSAVRAASPSGWVSADAAAPAGKAPPTDRAPSPPGPSVSRSPRLMANKLEHEYDTNPAARASLLVRW